MTKRKNVVSKMLLLVLILTLISCCFLGSTFARYTSSGEGSGTLQVAKWDVSITGNGTGTTALAFGQLSPAMEAYESTPRTHSTGRFAIATITNKSDVKAEVTFTVGQLEFKNSENGAVTYGDSGYNDEILRKVFTIKFYDAASGGSELSLQGSEYTTTLEKTTGSITIYAEITWNSDVAGATGATADARDTWIGQNVATITCTFDYVAVQITETTPAQA